MALIQEKVPGCYIYIGSTNETKDWFLGITIPGLILMKSVLPRAAALMTASAD